MTNRDAEDRFVVHRWGSRWAVQDLGDPSEHLSTHDQEDQAQEAADRRNTGRRRQPIAVEQGAARLHRCGYTAPNGKRCARPPVEAGRCAHHPLPPQSREAA